MATFEVGQAFELDTRTDTHGLIRTITPKSLEEFRQSAESARRGVYVFGLRPSGGGAKPWYVGLAKDQTFAKEATAPDKLRKFAVAMFGRTGTPLLFLVMAPRKGPKDSVDALERMLIWIARARNPKLVNERKVGSSPKEILALVTRLSITGVLNKRQGQPSIAAKAFMAMMGL